MEIITAGDGTAHVSSADDGAIYAGIIGQGCYVTGIGDKLSCTMQGANTALVGTGVGIMYGRAFRVAMPEEVTIQSGTQSQRRHDVICAHFTTSSDGHESGELVVLKGTPTSGQEADDPEVPSGDILEGATEAYMPLWRIPLDGINVGDPEPLFDVLMSMADLRDSVSQLALVKDVTMPSTTVGANTVAVQRLDAPTVEGYDPIGVVGANSWHGQAVYQGFSLSESTVTITLRNVSGSSITTSGSVSILYMKRLV